MGPLPNTCPPPRLAHLRPELSCHSHGAPQKLPAPTGNSTWAWGVWEASNPPPHSVDHPAGYPGDCSPVWGSWRKDPTDPPMTLGAGLWCRLPQQCALCWGLQGHTAGALMGRAPSSACGSWSRDPRSPRAVGPDCGLLNPSPYRHTPGWGLQGHTWVGAPQTGELLEERPHRSQGA